MKRKTILSLAALTGLTAFVISQAAADPDPSSSSPQPGLGSPEAVSPVGDTQTCGRSDQFAGERGKFRHGDRQWGRHRDHFADWRMLDRLLNLTDEQKEKVKEIMTANQPKIKAIHEEQRAKIQAVMDDARQQIRPLLTSDQQKVFDDAEKLRADARKLREQAKALRQEKQGNPAE